MKTVQLAKVAAQAELLRVKRMVRRLGTRIAFLVAAGLFGLFALAFLHVGGWELLARPRVVGPVWASFIVLGVDLLLTILLLMLGRGSVPDPVEVEARVTRDRSLAELRNAAAIGAVTSTVTGPIGRAAGRGLFGLIRRALPGRRRA